MSREPVMNKKAGRKKKQTEALVNLEQQAPDPIQTNDREAAGDGSLLEGALDYLPLGITVKDLSGTIVYTNFAEGEMHGYKVEEIISREARIFAPQQLWKPLTFEQIKDLKIWKRESVNLRKSGEMFPVFLTSNIIRDPKGAPVGIVTVCEDITGRKRTEEDLKKTEGELKKRERELQELYEIEVNRELRMKDLRREIEELKQKLYEIPSLKGRS